MNSLTIFGRKQRNSYSVKHESTNLESGSTMSSGIEFCSAKIFFSPKEVTHLTMNLHNWVSVNEYLTEMKHFF